MKWGSSYEDNFLYKIETICAEHFLHPLLALWCPIGESVGYGLGFVNQVADGLQLDPKAIGRLIVQMLYEPSDC